MKAELEDFGEKTNYILYSDRKGNQVVWAQCPEAKPAYCKALMEERLARRKSTVKSAAPSASAVKPLRGMTAGAAAVPKIPSPPASPLPTRKLFGIVRALSRKLAMLAEVPLALARNMPGAGFTNSLILSDLTPPPSIESKTVVFTLFFALQGCETQVKCTILRFSGYHSIWVAFIAFRYSMKKIIMGTSSMIQMAVLASIWGAFFFVTFKLPFHALPLLRPHPASFPSFTPGASSYFFTRRALG